MKTQKKVARKTVKKVKPIEKMYATLGSEVQRLRKAAGLTQEGLALKSPLSRASIANIERGGQRVMVHDLLHLASNLATTPAKLFGKMMKEAA